MSKQIEDRYLYKKKSSCEFDNIEECNFTPSIFKKYSIAITKENPFFHEQCNKVGLSKSFELNSKNPQHNASYPTEDDTILYKKLNAPLLPSNKQTSSLHFESNSNKQSNLKGDQTLPSITITNEEIKDTIISMMSSSIIANVKMEIQADLLLPFEEIRNSIPELYKIRMQQVPLVYFPNYKKKIIVLDIDETLSHNLSEDENTPLTIHNIYYKSGEYAKVVLRPYFKSFLDILSRDYCFIAFTAGMKKYAESIVRLIDPKRNYFLCELYRNDCINVNNVYYLKDIRQIGNLSQLIFIDNCLTSFALQLDNGIKIKPFYGDPNDKELALLIEFLQSIRNCQDVRTELRKKYNYSMYLENYIGNAPNKK